METQKQKKEVVKTSEDEAARLMRLVARLVRLSRKSMRTLGSELGLGTSMVSKVLTGIVRPQLSYLLMFAQAVGVSPDELFSLAYRHKKRPANALVKALLEADGGPEEEPDLLRLSQAELDQKVEAAVRRALQRLGAGELPH